MSLKTITLALCATGAAAFLAPSQVAMTRATRAAVRVSMSEEITDDLMSPATPLFNPQDEAKLFVGNLNFATEDEDLANIFGEFGPIISAEHVSDRFDPMRKRGFGFVVFEDKASAQAAVDALDGNDVDGRTVKVEFFSPKPRTERTERRPMNNRGADEDGKRVYVGNLDYRTDDATLSEIFSEYGEIVSCSQLTEREDPSRKRGFGFVTFVDTEAAQTAVENLDGLEVDGRNLRVNIAQPRPPRW